MTSDPSSETNIKTRTSCPLCHEDLIIQWQSDNIPFFGEVMYITTRCDCGFRFADTMILTQKEPVHYEITINCMEDLNARFIRSTSGTVRIPELGIDVEPGMASESYVTNIEGILDRIKDVVITATNWVKDDETKYARGLEVQNVLDDAMNGKGKLTVVIEDPLGNSAIISDSAISRPLTREEAGKLKTGMIVFDVDSSELTVDVSEKAQPVGN
ncbi:MAG: ZPR1 zinc finger domain-containing protein [Methanosarcinaceae archaeon]|nr:ZPR1 zinc finger domain-containing protein [Methanosarcinaceae archaeon]